jgi:hypothetical protein
MTATSPNVDTFYKVRKGVVDIVTLPELSFVAVDGRGDPEGPEFADAIQALYSVSYGAHFLIKKRYRMAPRVMPLEALWWVDEPEQRDIVNAVARGQASMTDTNRDQWRWRAMIMQPDPIDGATIGQAIDQARGKSLPALDRLRYLRWEEGRSAQTLHIGPYAAEQPSIVRLHDGIAAAGYRPRGHHHEIYLGDPRRAAPGKLRTLLRQPVDPA